MLAAAYTAVLETTQDQPHDVAHAASNKVTPVGQRTGEFCAHDRAILFEDPTGVRILYDPGNTVAGAVDSRLGAIDVILISRAHSDHLGNAKLNQDPIDKTPYVDSLGKGWGVFALQKGPLPQRLDPGPQVC